MKTITVCLMCAATLGMGLLYGPAARAAFVLRIDEVGADVVATGSGSIDVADLTLDESGRITPYLESGEAIVFTGKSGAFVGYGGATGPGNFGHEDAFPIVSGSGDFVGIAGAFGEVAVPTSYDSGGPLSSSAIWLNQSFASMGIDPGIYVWTWNAGRDTDSFAVEIGVPEPSTWGAMLVGFLGLAIVRYRATRRTAAGL